MKRGMLNIYHSYFLFIWSMENNLNFFLLILNTGIQVHQRVLDISVINIEDSFVYTAVGIHQQPE